MAEIPKSGNPIFDSWMEAGRRMFETGSQANPMAAMMGADGLSDAVKRAEENWVLCQRQAADWATSAARWLSTGSSSSDGIAEETLKRMLDPTRFLFAGTDEINQAIQRLVEGPEFADIGTIERQMLKATREWLALREASAAYRGITAAAWSRAFQTFSGVVAKEPDLLKQGSRAVLDRWLAIANEELIRTQRTDQFLKAQRELLSAGVAYRLKEREIVEVWCETHSIPTRTEVDDLHRTVHDLRRQVRSLSKQLSEARTVPAQAPAPVAEPVPEAAPAPDRAKPARAAPRRRATRSTRGEA